ncbi:prenyltransferase [Leucobacter triazinivorans]|uniref:Prenyltransferase n=1 Tax=Leucobacter triazinivorans TaxID=1784719 RepID=A0A4P6KFF9_9MICO|nr:prenyltransferase [Leucobacter triazinivorans]QBE48711.1 prenyltransferase [Leucobacter triazinivorans]
MSYPLVAGAFLALAAGAGLLLARRAGAALSWPAVALAGAALILLTAVFDSLMIAAGLFSYAPDLVAGPRIGLAPIEDFAYPIAAVLALPALWALLTRPGGASMGRLLRHAWVASRPVSWVNTAFPFAAAMLLTTREIDWLLVVGTIYYLVPYNLAMYGINDVFDYPSDVRNPRKGGIEGALLPPEYHRPMVWLAAATNAPFLLILLVSGDALSAAAIALSTFALVAYSAPGLRFKERPLLDSITSSTHFVSPALVGLALAGARFDSGLVLVLLAFFVWGLAAHAFGAVQDILPDREAGIGSIATVIGARRTVRLALLLWIAAGAIMLAVPWPGPLAALVALPYLLNCLPYANVSDADSARTNRAWRRFILLNYFSGFLVTLTMILFWSISS